MIRNGAALAACNPLRPMFTGEKRRAHGVSYGPSEAGYDIRIKQAVTLHPLKRFTLASSVEEFTMPEDLVAIVHDKSTWARRGLSVFNTVIEPGWHGFLTLELVYHGWRPIHVPAGAGIAQIVFHELAECRAYDGKYQGQGDAPVGAIFEGGVR
jgi:dCTP deaminase